MLDQIESRISRHRSTRVQLMLIGIAMLLAIPTGAVFAQANLAPYTLVESGQRFGTLQQAVSAVGDGSGTISIAPGTWRDCAVQVAGDIAYVAETPGKVTFDGQVCEGKAALVMRGRSMRVDGLTFQNLRVPDGNGAGIRLEHGDLTVRQSWFRDSEEGILSADDASGTALVERSTFSRLGRCDRGLSCAHSVYFGNYGNVVIRRSRFEEGRGGHYVKSRAARIEVVDSSFDDSRGKGTNYMIDLSTGATGIISGNWFVQGRDKENYSAFITNGAEGHDHSAIGLTIRDNVARLAPGVDRATVFFADWTGDAAELGPNALGTGLKLFERR